MQRVSPIPNHHTVLRKRRLDVLLTVEIKCEKKTEVSQKYLIKAEEVGQGRLVSLSGSESCLEEPWPHLYLHQCLLNIQLCIYFFKLWLGHHEGSIFGFFAWILTFSSGDMMLKKGCTLVLLGLRIFVKLVNILKSPLYHNNNKEKEIKIITAAWLEIKVLI